MSNKKSPAFQTAYIRVKQGKSAKSFFDFLPDTAQEARDRKAGERAAKQSLAAKGKRY